MSETTPPASDGQQGNAQTPPARLSIVNQYIKDLSFENPRAPQAFRSDAGKPDIKIKVDVGARDLGSGNYEVNLKATVNASQGDNAMFVTELDYAGVFNLQNIPQEALNPLLLIECPRLLFPFVRRVVADVTRDGGFPPLMIDPIDFAAMYRQRLAAAKAQQQGENNQPDLSVQNPVN